MAKDNPKCKLDQLWELYVNKENKMRGLERRLSRKVMHKFAMLQYYKRR